MNKRNISNLRKQDIIELAELVAEKYVENDNMVAQKTYESLGMQQSHYLMYEENTK